ncbi:MAG: CZB domain-containing protein [Gemmatimonadetes bacterium]|jgi:methyl-accepting chemotaxis protein|nr:CZB domain-containing protein [Gemmatimonadota bacterium]MBP9199093.1 CZB domain-containing protein [Gemmatimonadales bacterium]MBK6781691.1 CZB domain-containing protein [Gemmatimonadota bacterium]MBK7350118.1 CZB domain-containing protein [Gemmatimonadota bacterium]MBK7715734.1 CZB domain-containing protein [Gemmatimonadota bacterium]
MGISTEVVASTKAELQQAIAAHGMWKSRLKSALAQGGTDQDVKVVRLDNHCAFGKWLHGCDAALKRTPFHDVVRKLHAEFHVRSAEVLTLATTGKRSEAEQLIGPKGAWTEASVALTAKMMEWQRTL